MEQHSPQLQEQELTPADIDKAEYIISLSSKKNSAFKSMMYLLRELEEQFKSRQKQNRIFYQVVSVVTERYKKQIYANQQLTQRIKLDLQDIEHDIHQLGNRSTTLKQELQDHEDELNEIREYAEQRRNKKSKRERQYHQLYHVPIVANQFKKKYVRARDKNLDAEEKVSEVRAIVDNCQRAIADVARSIGDCHKTREQLSLQKQDLEKQIKNTEDLVCNLQEGHKFWSSFDQYQANTASRATITFIETIQKHANAINSKLMDPNNDFVKIFRLALYEYGQAEKYAQGRWGQIQVEFDCAKCHQLHQGWPKPDKVRTQDLLCEACYQENRTNMIWEKKISGVKDRSQQLLSLPGGSMLSFSSQSTATSNDSNSSPSKKKPGFKKMIQLFKNGKRSSSSSGSSTSLDYYHANNNDTSKTNRIPLTTTSY
jgi:hypothetical protein